ncbi:hypothetical protein LX64_02598 [Chitinophaga skermanii]|uniref:Ig-like domain-containing protein n=1 Tax=Chitinophaga skermanii TaxID=331697 RepID=A0A327QM81_9BACT|nr:hypothetical protein [Chitinophaga skermanii]RAJ05440.1 hypothetical protein LX64_02598 [Chitinophaga skermanii]
MRNIFIVLIGAIIMASCVKDNSCPTGVQLVVKKNTVAMGDSLHLRVEGAPSDIYSYYWHGPNNFVSNDAEPIVPNVRASSAGYYYVTIATNTGCNFSAKSDSVIVGAIEPACNVDINTAGPQAGPTLYDLYMQLSPGFNQVVVEHYSRLKIFFFNRTTIEEGVYNLNANVWGDPKEAELIIFLPQGYTSYEGKILVYRDAQRVMHIAGCDVKVRDYTDKTHIVSFDVTIRR